VIETKRGSFNSGFVVKLDHRHSAYQPRRRSTDLAAIGRSIPSVLNAFCYLQPVGWAAARTTMPDTGLRATFSSLTGD
jgi:hypothetical protein